MSAILLGPLNNLCVPFFSLGSQDSHVCLVVRLDSQGSPVCPVVLLVLE